MRCQAVFAVLAVLAVLVLMVTSVPVDDPRSEVILDTSLPDSGMAIVRVKKEVRTSCEVNLGTCRNETNGLHANNSDLRGHIKEICEECAQKCEDLCNNYLSR